LIVGLPAARHCYDHPVTERTLTADRGDAARRLDLMLCRHLQDIDSATRSRVQAWIHDGAVTVNGAVVRRVAARTAIGDIVSVMMPATAPRPAMAVEHLPLQILYEDDSLVAIDKPPGMVVHPTYKHMTGTILNGLLWRARTWPAGHRPSIVGRLDKDTSGIVVVAKTAAMHAALQRELASSRSEKDYLAVVHGRVNLARGEIDLPLRRDPSDRRRVIVSALDGAPSLTRFERLARSAAAQGGTSLLRCRLITGRTHQIRVHLAARGWPLIGDPVYGAVPSAGSNQSGSSFAGAVADPMVADRLRAFPRQALHAWRLSLIHPLTRTRLSLEAPVPDDLTQLMTGLALNLLFLRRMKTNQTQPAQDDSSLQKNPDEWKTGDEPMTASQRSYLETLSSDVGETFDENLSKADASKLIDELRQRSPRVSGDGQ
jgi:23S rRNA pseudouridine1911/1915/1917 synthase